MAPSFDHRRVPRAPNTSPVSSLRSLPRFIVTSTPKKPKSRYPPAPTLDYRSSNAIRSAHANTLLHKPSRNQHLPTRISPRKALLYRKHKALINPEKKHNLNPAFYLSRPSPLSATPSQSRNGYRTTHAAAESDNEDDQEPDMQDDEYDSDNNEYRPKSREDSSEGEYEWIDGKTLIERANILVGDQSDTLEEELAAKLELVQEFTPTFSAQAIKMRKNCLEVFDPALKNMKIVFSHITSNIQDETFLDGGVSLYDQASEEHRTGAVELETMLREETDATQERLKNLFDQLRQLEEKRAEWWTRVDALFEQHAEASQELYDRTEANMKKTIALAERKIDELYGKGPNGGVGKKKSAKNGLEKILLALG